MLPAMPVRMGFDPRFSDNPDVRELWTMPAGRLLALLWAPTHLISSCWWATSCRIANRIQKLKPGFTAESLYQCFYPELDGGMDYTPSDCREFCEAALPYFSGERSVDYVGAVAGSERFKPL